MASPNLSVPFNNLVRNATHLKPELMSVFGDFIDGGHYILGPNHELFEAELATYVGVSSAIGCANGTDALQLAMRALGVCPGDQILIAANAGGYSMTAINLIGAEPVFADIDAHTHLLTVDTIAKAVEEQALKPKAIVVTHLYGAAAKAKEIHDWAKSRGIFLIEDCAQALGARDGVSRVGSLADIATTSFYPTKNLGALGDGGAVLTNDANLSKKIKELRQYGWTKKYHTETQGGTNSRLDEIQAAILRVKLRNLDDLNQRRREIHSRYEAAGKNLKFVNTSSDSFIGHLAVIEVPNRTEVVEYLQLQGIATDIHYPIPDHKQVIRKNHRLWELPVTEALALKVLSIPLFPELLEEEILGVESALKNMPANWG
jgi:dTDP-4-amino-4,6-dideoxygalactose transaminase